MHLQNNPLCEWCKELDKTTIANVVDHKQRIKAGGDPLAMDNLQSLCTKCHATKSAYEANFTNTLSVASAGCSSSFTVIVALIVA